MAMNRWYDCRCEDFPCCGHYDDIRPTEDYVEDPYLSLHPENFDDDVADVYPEEELAESIWSEE